MAVNGGRQHGLAILLAISVNHFMQRPLRDSMAAFCGAENLNWLMSGTLLGTILLSAALVYIERKANMIKLIPYFLVAVALVQIVIYQKLQHPSFANALFYFAMNGATSLTMLSLVLKRVLTAFPDNGNEVFDGYTACSLGAIGGPLLTLGIGKVFDDLTILPLSSFLLLSIALSLISMNKETNPQAPIQPASPVPGFPLKRLILFVLMYTFIATAFYFFMIKTIATAMPSEDRMQFFSMVDLVTNSVVLVLPYLLQRWSRKPIAFLIVPCLAFILLSTLGIRLTMVTAALALIVFKVSNLSLQRPARELLHASFVIPYGTKNFLDTTIYRLGDVLAAWAIGMMLSSGLQLEQIALYMLPVTLLWLVIGYTISKNIKLSTA